MDRQVDKAILRRIKKILNLAENNPEVEEATRAAEQAAALMERYRLDRAVVEALGGEAEHEPIAEEEIYRFTSKVQPQWIGALSTAIAAANDCEVYWWGHSLRIVGRTTDRQATKMLFDFLTVEIERLAKESLKKRGIATLGKQLEALVSGDAAAMPVSPRTYANNFRLGAVTVLRRRLHEREHGRFVRAEEAVREHAPTKEPIPTGYAVAEQAMVIIRRDREEVDLFFRDLSTKLGLRSKQSSPGRFSHEGYTAGVEAGKRIHLGGQLGKGKK